jgi:acetyl esterase/lipase
MGQDDMSHRTLTVPEVLAVLSLSLVTPATAADEPTTKTFAYKAIPGGTLEMVVHYPPGWRETDRRPAIVFFFGGGWENGTIQAFQRQADHLARRGMVAARADYRVKSRQGANPDRCVEDAKSAVRWLRAHAARLGIDPDRIVAAGGSAGGHIAACTALTEGLDAQGEDRSVSPRPNALVLLNPVLRFHGLPAMMKRIGNDEAIGKAISPTLHVSKATPPTLLFYGTDDWLLGQGREFMSRSKEVGFRAELFTAEGQGHGFFHRPPWFQRTTARMDQFLTSLGYLAPPPEDTRAAEEGWVPLFDGKTLDGWKVRGGFASYKVEDGAIVGTTVEGSPNTFLCQGDYRDFVLELEVKCDPRLNSGVQVRSHVYREDDPDPKNRKRAGVVYGPQCEIARKETGTAGRFYDEGRRGRWLNEIKPEAEGAFRDDGWNRYRIVVQGDRYRSWVNGVPCADFKDDRDKGGFIGLQVHGVPRGQGPYQVRWRDVRIRELKPGEEGSAPTPPEGFKAVFNGRDLTGWEGSPPYWSVEDGCLTGRADGTLKFNRFLTWRGGAVRNFELRVKVNVSAGGNSGLQYRGTERPDLGESVVTGYQCDVVANRPDYNGMLYEERGRRILAHTGEKVIIDPQGQPWVVGQFPLKEFKPGEWHDYRVLAEGNHYRHWIDGQPTVDVIDLDEKGRKLDGVLAVQVHVGPPMTIRYRDFLLKRLPDDLPLITPDQAPVPPDVPKVAPQGQDRPRKPDAG